MWAIQPHFLISASLALACMSCRPLFLLASLRDCEVLRGQEWCLLMKHWIVGNTITGQVFAILASWLPQWSVLKPDLGPAPHRWLVPTKARCQFYLSGWLWQVLVKTALDVSLRRALLITGMPCGLSTGASFVGNTRQDSFSSLLFSSSFIQLHCIAFRREPTYVTIYAHNAPQSL